MEVRVSMDRQGIRRTAAGVAAGLIVTAAFTAIPAAAQPVDAKAVAAKPSCYEVPYTNRLQAENNAAGVIFQRKGDIWKLWDNQRDDWLVRVEYNYAGVDDEWKIAAMHSDGGQGAVPHNVSERFDYLCFRLYSPRFGYTDAIRYRT
jgi:hypothetical protein